VHATGFRKRRNSVLDADDTSRRKRICRRIWNIHA
jgi:hypothetical protein